MVKPVRSVCLGLVWLVLMRAAVQGVAFTTQQQYYMVYRRTHVYSWHVHWANGRKCKYCHTVKVKPKHIPFNTFLIRYVCPCMVLGKRDAARNVGVPWKNFNFVPLLEFTLLGSEASGQVLIYVRRRFHRCVPPNDHKLIGTMTWETGQLFNIHKVGRWW